MAPTLFPLPQAKTGLTLTSRLAGFAASERGAVTVDWVVLTSALVGLGLATLSVVAVGVGEVSNDTSDVLEGTSISAPFGAVTSLFSGDFSAGTGGFIGGTLATVAGFGDVLQVGQNATAQLSLSVPAGATSATIDFDLIAADDFDGDTATVFVNGQAVSFYTDNNGTISVVDGGVPGVTVSVDQQYTDSNHGGGSLGDSRASYSITIDNPGTNVTFGVHSNATAGSSNEFFALDDVEISSN